MFPASASLTSSSVGDPTLTTTTRRLPSNTLKLLRHTFRSSTTPDTPITPTAATTATPSQHDSQLKNLNKLFGNYLTSAKYIEFIISKAKLEILSTACTSLIEAILDIYNMVRSIKVGACARFKHASHLVNVSLARLVKWCDSLKISSNSSEKSLKSCFGELSADLTMRLTELINALKVTYFSTSSVSVNGRLFRKSSLC